MSVTAFGKFLRKLRVDNELILRDMAVTLSISSAQLSAMELGNRTIQNDIAQKINANYKIDVAEIQKLIDSSQPSIKTDLKAGNEKQRETMIMFARAFTEMSEDQLESVQEILNTKRVENVSIP